MALEKIVTILDIGSSKIVCLIAKINNQKVNIIGSGCNSANGFKNGNVNDSKSARMSIISAIEQAENSANVTIDKVILALNGNRIASHYLNPSITLKKHKVTKQDISDLVMQGVKQLESQGNEVIHYFPLEYILDHSKGITDPIGLVGNKLSSNIHFVTIPNQLLENLVSCLASCQLDIEDCIFSPYAAGLSTLNENERIYGSTVIDLGAGITSYAVFSRNNLVNCGSIPIGSNIITTDISKSFMLDPGIAERVKTIHGAASVHYADSQKMISYKVETSMFGQFDNEERQISNAELNEVINARLEEIFQLSKQKLTNSANPHNFSNVIVLTGGGSMLTGISELAENVFSSKVRLGKPTHINGLGDEVVNATYASAIGVLQYLASGQQKDQIACNTSLLKRIINWLKDNF